MADSAASGLIDALIGLFSAIIGAAVGAWMTTQSEGKRRKTEIALDLVGKYFEQYDHLARALWLLRNPEALKKDRNTVLRMGDWYDTFAALIVGDMADRKLLDRIGMPEQMRTFYAQAVKAGLDDTPVRDAVGSWTNLRRLAVLNGYQQDADSRRTGEPSDAPRHDG
ncbi:MAG TPA: hypothetical protein VEF06_07690 [Bryobacteraceae bacterium]|nr:hypothetical protein [Bryobacteraceae bacterium]